MSIIRSISLMAAAMFVLVPGTVQAQLGFTFGSDNGQQEEHPFSATAHSSTDTYKKGEAFYIAIQGDVQAPWHAYYRNPATFGEAMEATLQAPAGFKVEGPFWSAPQRHVSDLSVAYTYDRPVVVWKVTPEADAPQNAAFSISTTAQVCTDSNCLPSDTHTFTLNLTEGEPATKEDWQAMESKVEVLGDAETTVTATSTATEVILTFSSAEPVEEAYFFSDDNSTDPTTDQTLAKVGDTQYTLTIPRNTNESGMQPLSDEAEALAGKPLPTVKGLLTFGGKHAKVDVTVGAEAPAAVPAETPAATVPAEAAAEATTAPAEEAATETGSEEEGDDEEEEEDDDEGEDAGEEADEPAAPAVAADDFGDDDQPELPGDANVSLNAEASVAAYKKGESFFLALHVDIKEPWHAYYRNPATFGSPMKAKLAAPAGFQVEGPYFSAPLRHSGDLGVAYTHEHPVIVWKVTPQADAPQSAAFKLKAKAQICSMECLAETTYAVTVELAEGEPAAAGWTGAEGKVEVLGNAQTTVTATSTATEVVLTFTSAEPVEEAYFFSDDNSTDPVADQTLAKAGDTQYTLTIPRNTNESGMQPLSDEAEALVGKPLPKVKGILTFGGKLAKVDTATTTGTTGKTTATGTEPSAEVTGTTPATTETTTPATTEPQPATTKEEAAAATETSTNAPYVVVKGPHPEWNTWSQALMDQALADGHPVFVDFTAKWCMTCQSNKKLGYNEAVYAEMEKAGVVLMRADKTKPNPEIDKAMAALKRSAVPTNALYRPGKKPVVTQEVFATPDYLLGFLKENLYNDTPGTDAQEEESMGFAALIGFLFLGGLILNLMPCVFPVIGLKVMSFVELGGGSRRKVFMHSMTFAAGILLSFWVLSLLLVVFSNLDALSQAPWTDWLGIIINDDGSQARNWAEWMQNPWVVYLILLLLLVLGLSMYGVFEIGVGATGVGQGLQQKKGLAGSFFQGFLVTVVATPCSGPFLGAAMPAVMALPGMLMVLGLTFMALGLASPYIVLGAFPKLVAKLPRPGAWMESLKQGLSFLLLAAAAWMLYTYLAFLPEGQPMETLIVFWCMVGVCCAFWVYGRWCPIYQSKTSRWVGLVVALVILGVSVFYSNPSRYSEEEAAPEQAPAATEEAAQAS